MGNSAQVKDQDVIMENINPCIKESILYERINGKVRCNTCERFCEINPNKLGFCKTRKNINGKLYTIEYGDISSFSANPIEKKPFFHFHPGSRAFTVGSWSCNFTCPWCQNFGISKTAPNLKRSNYISPQKIIKLMKEEKCQGTSISFNEPTLLLEYSLDVFDLTNKEGYYNTYITNGYMTREALKLLVEHGLSAANFDVKGDEEAVEKYCSADVEKVWRNIRDATRSGVHVEITTLVIPGVNDDEECLRSIAHKIKREIDEDTPWHIIQYYPAYKALEIGLYPSRTPVETLENAWKIGKQEGLNYVYIGNVPGHRFENTYCHNCNELLIKRFGFNILNYKIEQNNTCPKCKERIPIVGTVHMLKSKQAR